MTEKRRGNSRFLLLLIVSRNVSKNTSITISINVSILISILVFLLISIYGFLSKKSPLFPFAHLVPKRVARRYGMAGKGKGRKRVEGGREGRKA